LLDSLNSSLDLADWAKRADKDLTNSRDVPSSTIIQALLLRFDSFSGTSKVAKMLRTVFLCGSIAVATFVLLDLLFDNQSTDDGLAVFPDESVFSIDAFRTLGDQQQPFEQQRLEIVNEDEPASRELPAKLPPHEVESAGEPTSPQEVSRENNVVSIAGTGSAASVKNPHFDVQSSQGTDDDPDRQFRSGLNESERAAWTQKVLDAYSLVERGRMSESHRQLVSIVEQIAQIKDQQAGVEYYTVLAAEGFQALAELKQILAFEGSDELLHVLIEGHSTFSQFKLDDLNKHELVIEYQTRVAAQLSEVVEQLEFGSMALCFLGKIQAQLESIDGSAGAAQALMQAALIADESNYWAANEYGIYLAKQDDLENARRMFAISNQLQPNPQAARNLQSVTIRLADRSRMKNGNSVRSALREIIESKSR